MIFAGAQLPQKRKTQEAFIVHPIHIQIHSRDDMSQASGATFSIQAGQTRQAT